LHAYKGLVMTMSNFENPTWRTAAILKIIISISQPQRKRDKNSEIRKFKMADRRRIENHYLAINLAINSTELTKNTIFTK